MLEKMPQLKNLRSNFAGRKGAAEENLERV